MLSRYIPKRFLFKFIEKENLNTVINLDSEVKQKAPSSINGVNVENHYPVNHGTVTKIIREHLFSKDHTDKTLLDCTVGTAGHAKLLLKNIPNLHM